MATLSVNVALARLGKPDDSSGMETLDAWELVRFDVGQGGTSLALTRVQHLARGQADAACASGQPRP